MKIFKGTQGNWNAIQTDKVDSHLDIAINSGGECIAWVYSDSQIKDKKNEFKANAQLIASAPEMLEAILYLKECRESWSDIHNDVKDKLETAIQKAIG